MRYYGVWLAVLLLFAGCGLKESEDKSSWDNGYETLTLAPGEIEGTFTLELGEGLNYEVTPSLAKDITVAFYSKEGNLSEGKIAMEADGLFGCNAESTARECTFVNDRTGEVYTFSFANISDDRVSFKAVAYQGSLSEGSDASPLIGLAEANYYNGQAGAETPSYYAFKKEGYGSVVIDLKEIDTISDTAEELVWSLTDTTTGDPVALTDREGNAGTLCRDAYDDGNVSCETESLADETTYRIAVENRGDGPVIKYKILISGE